MTSGWDEITRGMSEEEWNILLKNAEASKKKRAFVQISAKMHPDQYQHYKKDSMQITQNEKNKRFTNAGGKLTENIKPEDKKLHFATILSNPDKYIWRASRNRWFYISLKHSEGIQVIEDKHLINVMRYLITNWSAMQDVVLFELVSFYKQFPQMLSNNKQKLAPRKSAPDFFNETLACWPTLVNETVERFGSDALLSLLDGN